MAKLPMKIVRERLGQWEAKLAPLSDDQKQVFVEISSATAHRPLPKNVRKCVYTLLYAILCHHLAVYINM